MKQKSPEGNQFSGSESQITRETGETSIHVSESPLKFVQDLGVYALPTPPPTPVKKGKKYCRLQ